MSTEKPKTARTGWYQVKLVRPNDQKVGGDFKVTADLLYVLSREEKATVAVLEGKAALEVGQHFHEVALKAPKLREKEQSQEQKEKMRQHVEALEEMGAAVTVSWPEDAGEEATEADADADDAYAVAEAEIQHLRERL